MGAILYAIWLFLVALGPFLIDLFGVIASVALALWELAKITAIVYLLYGAFEILFRPDGKQRVGNFLANIVGGALSVATPVLTALTPSLQGIVSAFATAFQTTGPGLADTVAAPAGAFAAANFNATIAALSTVDESTADNAVTQAAAAIKDAFGKGMSSAAVTAAFESVFPERLNTLNGIGPMLAQMAGFGDVSGAIREPLYRAAFGKSAEYLFNRQFTPNLPDSGHAAEWLARRIIGPAEFDVLFSATGLKGEFETNYTTAAYRPVQPRTLANLYQDIPFPRAQVMEMLQDHGVSDLHIPILLDAYEYNSVKNVRQQYLSSIIRSAELGSISEAELQSDLQGLGFSTTAQNLVALAVANHRLDSILTLYRREIDILYSTNQLTDAQYLPALTAAGMDESLANGYYGIASSKLHGKELAASARAEAKLAAQVTRLAVSTAKSLYLSGQIDALAMAAAVTASGLDLSLVPLTIALFTAEYSAKRQDVYGLLLPRDKAIVLREQVSALKEQFIKKALDLAGARAQLVGFNIPAQNIEALLSEWQAQTYKTALPV